MTSKIIVYAAIAAAILTILYLVDQRGYNRRDREQAEIERAAADAARARNQAAHQFMAGAAADNAAQESRILTIMEVEKHDSDNDIVPDAFMPFFDSLPR